MGQVTISGTSLGNGFPCQVIAEVGINHNGDMEIAKKLIMVAAEAGCWMVKFQKRSLDIVYTPQELETPRESPFGLTNGDLKRRLEFGLEEYREIDRYCREVGILWTASAWDLDSLDFIERFDPPCHKVASAMVTNLPFLRKLATLGRPVIMSTGMCTFEMIHRAIEIVGDLSLVLLHAVSTYPSENDECCLRMMQDLERQVSPCIPVGYSGHERGLSISLAAAVMGACLIERHITLDRALFGSDQPASLEPEGLRRLVRDIRDVESALGGGGHAQKVISDREAAVAKKLRYWEGR